MPESRHENGRSPEPGLEPIHSLLFRVPVAVYIVLVGLALGAVFLSVALAARTLGDVPVPRWAWIVNCVILLAFLTDHFRVGRKRRSSPGAGKILAATAIACLIAAAFALFATRGT